MTRLERCLGKVSKLLNKDESALLRKEASAYEKDGMNPIDAAKTATSDAREDTVEFYDAMLAATRDSAPDAVPSLEAYWENGTLEIGELPKNLHLLAKAFASANITQEKEIGEKLGKGSASWAKPLAAWIKDKFTPVEKPAPKEEPEPLNQSIDKLAENTRKNLEAFDAETKRLQAEQSSSAEEEAPDTSHLDALEFGLFRAREKAASAKTPSEKKSRDLSVRQYEKEIAGELKFLGKTKTEDVEMSDDELLAALEATPQTPPTPEVVETVTAPATETKAAKAQVKAKSTAPKKLKAQKEYLLAALDKAIEEAPETRARGSWDSEISKEDYQNAEYTPNVATIEKLLKKYGVEVADESKPLTWFDNRKPLRDAIHAKHWVSSGHPRLVEISVPGDGTFRIVNDKSTLKDFRKRAGTRFPTTVGNASEPTSTTPRETAITKRGKPENNRDFIALAGMFVSDDPQRETLQVVHSDGENLVATNGRQMMVIKRKVGGTEEKPLHFYAKTQKGVTLEGNYPGWKQVIPREFTDEVEIDTAAVQKIVIQAKAIAGKGDDQRTLMIWKDDAEKMGYTLEAEQGTDANGAIYQGGMFSGGDANPETAKFVTALNVFYFIDGLKAMRLLGYERVTMKFSASSMMLEAEGSQYVQGGIGVEANSHPLSQAEEERTSSLPEEEPKIDARSEEAVPMLGTEGEAASPAAPAEAKPDAKSKKPKEPSAIALLENYFTPGKIVKSYGGEDRVISFDRGEGEQWSVTVQAVDDSDGRGPRSHSTMPSNRDLIRAWQTKNEEQAAKEAAPEQAADVSTAEIKSAPVEERNLNARHTVNLSDVLTPAGAIKASVLRKDSDSSVWHYQGNFQQLAFNVNVTINGESDASDYHRKALAEVKAAQADGWRGTVYKAASFGSMRIFVKGDKVLTNAGAEALVSGKFATPEIDNEREGWQGMASQQAEFSSKLANWLATLPDSTLDSASAFGAKVSTTKIGEWLQIERSGSGVKLWLVNPQDKRRAVAISGETLQDALKTVISYAANTRDGVTTDNAFGFHSFTNFPGVQEAATVGDALRAAGFKKQEEASSDAAPITNLSTLFNFFDQLREGKVTADEVKAAWGTYKGVENELRKEVVKMTMKELERFQGMRKPDNKAEAVKMAMEFFEGRFNPGNMLSYGGVMGRGDMNKARRDDMDKAASQWTDEVIQSQAQERKDAKAARDKALENPETLDEWKQFVRRKGLTGLSPEEIKAFNAERSPYALEPKIMARGEGRLTPEQLSAYDEVRGIDRKSAVQAKKEQESTVRGVNADTDSEIIETKHTKTGADLFVVKLADRVEKDVYTSLNAAAKKMGGYYSSYRVGGAVPGFQFKDRATAEQFQAITKGETVDRAEAVQERQAESKNAAAERLTAMADKMEEAAEASLNADRKTNTAKRAREAGTAETSARTLKALATTMRNLASAIESGNATHLDGVRTKTHVDTLEALARRAKSEAERTEDLSYGERQKREGEPTTPEQIDKAKYPFPFLNETAWQWLIDNGNNTPGAKRLTARLEKVFAAKPSAKENGSYLTGADMIEVVKELLGKIKKQDYTRTNIEDVFKPYDRVQAMGLKDLPSLRAALREFLQYRGTKAKEDPIKAMERELVGMKIPGFFPTPQTVIEEMLDRVGNLEGKHVLEPSGGKGDIADAAKAAGADVDVIEQQSRLRNILEARGHRVIGWDFMDADPNVRGFTYGDVFQNQENTKGIMRGQGGAGSDRVRLVREDGTEIGKYNRSALEGIEKRGSNSGYDAVLMNPPFEDGQDGEHVQRAFQFLKPGGKLVAITGEGIFFRSDKKSKDFRDWLESVDGTSEKLPEGSFKSAFRPTGVATRIVVVTKPADTLRAAPLPKAQNSDTEYLAAVEAGDMETAQRILNQKMENVPEHAVEFRKTYGNLEVSVYGRDDVSTPKVVALLTTLADSIKIETVEAAPDAKGQGYGKAIYLAIARYAQEGYKESITGSSSQDALNVRKSLFPGTTVRNQDDLVFAESRVVEKVAYTPKSLVPSEDSEYNVIPLSQRFDSASDSILYAGPAAKPAPETSPVFRYKVPIKQDWIDEAEAHMGVFGAGSMGADPKFANFGGKNQTVRNQVDIVRAYDMANHETRKDRDTFARAKELLAKDPDGVYKMAMDGAYTEGAHLRIDDHQQLAIQMLVQRLGGQANGNKTKIKALQSLIWANILNRKEAARTLRAGIDRFMTPAERADQQVADLIFRLHSKIEKRAKTMTYAERKAFFEQAGDARIKEVEAALKKAHGLRLDQVLRQRNDAKSKATKLEREILKLKKVLDQNVIQMIKKGATPKDVERVYQVTPAEAAAMLQSHKDAIAARLRQMFQSGMTMAQIKEAEKDNLRAGPIKSDKNALTPDQIEAEIARMMEDYKLPEKSEWLNRKALPKTPKAKVPKTPEEKAESHVLTTNWSKPEFYDGLNGYEFDTKDRAGIMDRVEKIRMIVGAVGQINLLTGPKQEQAKAALAEIDSILSKYGTDAEGILNADKGIESYGFDPADMVQMAAIARTINQIDADWIDKTMEFLYANMLWGPQTAIVNATAAAHAVYQMTVGRGMEMAINHFVNDPMAAQFGEVKYVIRALKPGLRRAMSNFHSSWLSQHPMVERDMLGSDVDWEAHAGGFRNQMKGGVIGGKFGDLHRTPLRILSATDDFNKTLFGMAEAAAFAYRLGVKKSQTKGDALFGKGPGTPEFEKFMRIEMNTPGSFSMKMGVDKASRMIFAQALPGQKNHYTGEKEQSDDIGGVIGVGAAKLNEFVSGGEHDSIAAKALLAMMRISFFPFQRTPFNIVRTGMRYAPNPISMTDILWGVASNSRQLNADTGKMEFKWNAQGRNPELIERVSMQLQGAVVMAALMAMAVGEGDDDDQDKWLVMTGTAPWSPAKRAEKEARERSGVGAYRVSWRRGDGSERAGFSYARIEPLATALSTTIDTLRTWKRISKNGGDASDIAANTLGGLVAQTKDKTFMRGFSDLTDLMTNAVAADDVKEPNQRKLNQFIIGKMAMAIPNFVKQPLREADNTFRERSDSFSQELMYQVFPYGQKAAKVDPYGDKLEKQKLTGSEAADSAIRAVDFIDAGIDKVNPVDQMLLRWRDSGKWKQAPDEADRKPYFPSPIISATFKNKVTGQTVKMDVEQLSEFREKAGKAAAAKIKSLNLNYKNPSPRDILLVKKAVEDARSSMKTALSHKFSRTEKQK